MTAFLQVPRCYPSVQSHLGIVNKVLAISLAPPPPTVGLPVNLSWLCTLACKAIEPLHSKPLTNVQVLSDHS